MKLSDERLILLDNALPKDKPINISDSLVRYCFHKFTAGDDNRLVHLKTPNQRAKAHSQQYEYVRRNLLKLKYYRNNSKATGIREGFVYAIGNPAWEDYVKIGSAIDVYDRLGSYQTSSPLRDYYLIKYFFSHDRVEDEKKVQGMFDRDGEWCKTTPEHLVRVFTNLRKQKSVPYFDVPTNTLIRL